MGAGVFEKGGKEGEKREISPRKGAKARRVTRNVPTRRQQDRQRQASLPLRYTIQYICTYAIALGEEISQDALSPESTE